mgnify:CR=1 FL=1
MLFRSPAAATVFAFLGLVPGPDIGPLAIAALTAEPAVRVAPLLRELETNHLIQHQPTPLMLPVFVCPGRLEPARPPPRNCRLRLRGVDPSSSRLAAAGA